MGHKVCCTILISRHRMALTSESNGTKGGNWTPFVTSAISLRIPLVMRRTVLVLMRTTNGQ
jgi:hypothetical protein